MTNNTSLTRFVDLPAEIRLMVWEAAYENTQRREVGVDFHFTSEGQVWLDLFTNWDKELNDDDEIPPLHTSLRSLFEVNRESLVFIKGRFVQPFSADLVTRRSKGPPESSQFDISRDTLYLRSPYRDFEKIFQNMWGVEKELFPLLRPFRFLFGKNDELVAKNLTSLKIDCDLGRSCGLMVIIDSDEEESENPQEVTDIKAYLPNLNKLRTWCKCGIGFDCTAANQKGVEVISEWLLSD